MRKSLLMVMLIMIGLAVKSSCLHVKQEPGIGNSDAFLEDSYNYFVTNNGNMVWAGALSLAWHQLTDNIIKEDVKLDSNDKLAQKIVGNYNNCPFKKSDLQESSYYIKSGYGQKTVTQINSQVKKKFPKKSFADIEASLKDQDIISYAYFAKTFEYPVKFQTNEDFKFKGSSVNSFSATTEQHRDQVSYMYYKNENEFMVKLRTKKNNEGVYLIRTDYKDASVADIIGQVNKWERQPLRSLGNEDRFEMPIVDLDYSREVPQVQNVMLLNKQFKNYMLATVYEGVKLKIDEAGVKAENEGVIIAKLTSALIPQEPKQFILDDTFWIVLKEQGKHPYMAIKVNDPKQKQEL